MNHRIPRRRLIAFAAKLIFRAVIKPAAPIASVQHIAIERIGLTNISASNLSFGLVRALLVMLATARAQSSAAAVERASRPVFEAWAFATPDRMAHSGTFTGSWHCLPFNGRLHQKHNGP